MAPSEMDSRVIASCELRYTSRLGGLPAANNKQGKLPVSLVPYEHLMV